MLRWGAVMVQLGYFLAELLGSVGCDIVPVMDGQRISKSVWPSSCRGPTRQRPGGMP